ncbi:hypothetical protein AVEN_90340-1 [Araneus ventricosus]|uniref:Uncharacterized protein n=1 Tax=Araneus ventricosus TaxID=182803 RepID=A0A4Y2N0F2_ARAVE|nr:hypothetical protein AVEN_90340-1 [Araneus ventricosus]
MIGVNRGRQSKCVIGSQRVNPLTTKGSQNMSIVVHGERMVKTFCGTHPQIKEDLEDLKRDLERERACFYKMEI